MFALIFRLIHSMSHFYIYKDNNEDKFLLKKKEEVVLFPCSLMRTIQLLSYSFNVYILINHKIMFKTCKVAKY